MDTRFHAVYLLSSLDDRCKGFYYVGYTVDPLRRLRQHNGELTNGAWRTHRRGRPWEMICCVSGFSEDRIALRFEWMWQHPAKSTHLRDRLYPLTSNRSIGKGLNYAIGLLHLLLTSDSFSSMSLRLNILNKHKFDACCNVLTPRILPALVSNPPLFSIHYVTREELKALYPTDDDLVRSYEEEERALLEAAGASNSMGMGADTSTESLSRNLQESSFLNDNQNSMSMISAGGGGGSIALNDRVLARSGLLPCSFCGLEIRFEETAMLCPQAADIASLRCRSPGGSAAASSGIPLSQSSGGAGGYGAQSSSQRCVLKAHITCMALWFYHQKRTRLLQKQKADASYASSPLHSNGVSSSSQLRHVVQDLVRTGADPIELVPTNAIFCPLCHAQTGQELQWASLVSDVKQRVNHTKARQAAMHRVEVNAMLAAQEQRLIDAGLLHKGKSKKKPTTTSASQFDEGVGDIPVTQQIGKKRARKEGPKEMLKAMGLHSLSQHQQSFDDPSTVTHVALASSSATWSSVPSLAVNAGISSPAPPVRQTMLSPLSQRAPPQSLSSQPVTSTAAVTDNNLVTAFERPKGRAHQSVPIPPQNQPTTVDDDEDDENWFLKDMDTPF